MRKPIKRRRALKTIGVIGGGLGVGIGGTVAWNTSGEKSYYTTLDKMYRPINLQDRTHVIREIARYSTMAPNSHNVQPWRVTLEESAIVLRPDLTRQCPVVDPDDHHLFTSLGCAAENAVQTAIAYGLKSRVHFDESSHLLRIEFSPEGEIGETPLFQAIPKRQTTRSNFDGSKLTDQEFIDLTDFEDFPGVELRLLTKDAEMEEILKCVIEGNGYQMQDAGFVAELREWIRSSYQEAVAQRDGLFVKCSGNPATPAWIGKRLFDVFFTEATETKKYEQQIRSSAGIAVFTGESESPKSWVEVGRCFENFALKLTSMGILHSHLNQPVEVPEVRKQLTEFLGIGSSRPDLVIRFGRGKPMLKSLRRPLEDVVNQDTNL